MKHLNLITLALTVMLSAALPGKAQQFTLTGNITGEPNAYIFLRYVNDKGETVKDSCSLKNGDFSFKGSINGPTLAYFPAFIGGLRVRDDSDPNSSFIFLEPGNITVVGKYGYLKDIKVTGSAAHNEFVANAALPTAQIISNPNSIVSAYELNLRKSRLALDTVEYLYKKMAPNVKQSKYGKEIEAYLALRNATAVGKIAQNFSASDVKGRQINLADFKGKYVLLDFWASWCGPCRESTPDLISQFNKYHKMGFEVIAMADDDYAVKEWKNAIANDKSDIWYNVLRGLKRDVKVNPDDINQKFGVTALPTRILINKDGIIVGRYTGTGDNLALDKKLAEVFKTK